MSKSSGPFKRPQAAELARRLAEPRRFIQVVAGARQVGKTTLVQQVTEAAKLRVRFASADEPTLRGADWIAQQWEAARLAAGPEGAILCSTRCRRLSAGPSPSSASGTRTRAPGVR
jgi:hypothetical protein